MTIQQIINNSMQKTLDNYNMYCYSCNLFTTETILFCVNASEWRIPGFEQMPKLLTQNELLTGPCV